MLKNDSCPLCQTPTMVMLSTRSEEKTFFQCQKCEFIFLDHNLRLTKDKENARYLEHDNNSTDEHYQNFVQPLVGLITQMTSSDMLGLDFGCGRDSSVFYLLDGLNYKVDRYDPYFFPEYIMSDEKYDFIVACEVVEHLFDPVAEFKKIKRWLKPGGYFFIQTHFWEGQDIYKWYYAKDPTHVSIFNSESLKQMCASVGFCHSKMISRRIAVLTK
jgi:SAM-dependent methyltransferase